MQISLKPKKNIGNNTWTAKCVSYFLQQYCHKTESLWNHTTTDHKEGEQLEDRRSVGASNCNSGDGTDQRVQSLVFVMMMNICREKLYRKHCCAFMSRLSTIIIFLTATYVLTYGNNNQGTKLCVSMATMFTRTRHQFFLARTLHTLFQLYSIK